MPQANRLRHLHLCSMRTQMIIDPAREDAGFHCRRPRLRKCLHPAIQVGTSRWNRPFPLNLPAYIFHAVADCLLVNVEPDVIHMFVEEPPWLFSESTSPLSSAFCTPRAPRSTYIQTIRELSGCNVCTAHAGSAHYIRLLKYKSPSHHGWHSAVRVTCSKHPMIQLVGNSACQSARVSIIVAN